MFKTNAMLPGSTRKQLPEQSTDRGSSLSRNYAPASLKILCLIAMSMAAVSFSGCRSSARLMTKGGINVTATSDQGGVTLKQDKSGAISISTGGQTFQVDDAEVRLNGDLVSSIPSGTKSLAISVTASGTTIQADGTEIYTSEGG